MSADFFLKSTEALWTLGLLPAEALPDIAIDALERGYQSQALLDLGGLPDAEMDEAPRLFEAVLSAIVPVRMTKEEALRHYARMVAASILSDAIPPQDGVARLARVLRESGAEIAELRPLLTAEGDAAIRTEAAQWAK
ncbi:hypothetical protein SAMN05444156_1086 [Verrucomicrobium sp. GAS474]|uniref:hypothetical protein n=1 Tax=Verrucomicrobium sp. GAS474 TaxID=1882831 RepID=UPI00087BA175|nr:hypothetical protein [Verrucomicrobium sp. GAS474]SDT96126.1 hypothetical protein SAMN05444156_1086 [Verrucomicrobium sp. GAS474]